VNGLNDLIDFFMENQGRKIAVRNEDIPNELDDGWANMPLYQPDKNYMGKFDFTHPVADWAMGFLLKSKTTTVKYMAIVPSQLLEYEPDFVEPIDEITYRLENFVTEQTGYDDIYLNPESKMCIPFYGIDSAIKDVLIDAIRDEWMVGDGCIFLYQWSSGSQEWKRVLSSAARERAAQKLEENVFSGIPFAWQTKEFEGNGNTYKIMLNPTKALTVLTHSYTGGIGLPHVVNMGLFVVYDGFKFRLLSKGKFSSHHNICVDGAEIFAQKTDPMASNGWHVVKIPIVELASSDELIEKFDKFVSEVVRIA
ncbi:MAG: hypothetical protein GWO08_03145, partial [Gammaproteobacteria bacterium]|nr:hypothetical protein [Gammaproteobacteria bacterium]